MSNTALATAQNHNFISDESLAKFNELEKRVASYQNLEDSAMGMMARAAAQSNVIAELQKALPDSMVMSLKKSLENNRLGFRTDKDDLQGYPVNVVRTALIESAVHGFNWYGNEFNIIGGNFYPTKEGFTGKIQRTGDFTDMDIYFHLPSYDVQNKRAVIRVVANWKYKGKPMKLDREFSIKLTIDKFGKNWTTDDAIEGKAERKVLAQIYKISTGRYIPDGDAEEVNRERSFDEKLRNAASIEPEIEEPLKDDLMNQLHQLKDDSELDNWAAKNGEAIKKLKAKDRIEVNTAIHKKRMEFAADKATEAQAVEQPPAPDAEIILNKTAQEAAEELFPESEGNYKETDKSPLERFTLMIEQCSNRSELSTFESTYSEEIAELDKSDQKILANAFIAQEQFLKLEELLNDINNSKDKADIKMAVTRKHILIKELKGNDKGKYTAALNKKMKELGITEL